MNQTAMTVTDAALTAFDVVVLVESDCRGSRLGDAVVEDVSVPATVIAPGVSQRVSSLAELRAALEGPKASDFAWRSDWVLVGPARTQASDLDARTREHLDELGPDREEARIRFFAEHYARALLPWHGTYGQRTFVFVTSDASAARHLVSRASGILAHYARTTSVSEVARFVLFGDDWIYGHLAWRLARESGEFPLVVYTQACDERAWWWQLAPWIDLRAERAAVSFGRAERRLVYRVTDPRLFDAITWRGRAQAPLPRLIVPESADLDGVFAYLDREVEERFDGQLERLAELGERLRWAQTWSFGGDENENQATFHAYDPAIAARLWELARTIRPGEDLRYGRL